MRIVKEIVRTDCRISIFQWNNRYLIKVEQNHLEQTFKIDQFDLIDEGQLEKVVDEEFLKEVLRRFDEMALSLRQALDRT